MASRTGLILASGRGSRMGATPVPKQLLTLPDGVPIVRRIAIELASECQAMACTIRAEKDRSLFEDAFRGIEPRVELHVKQGDYEYAEIAEVVGKMTTQNIIQTNGDLIFAPGVVRDFVRRYGDSERFVMGREGNRANRRHALDVVNSRISVVPLPILRLFGTKTPTARLKIVAEIFSAFLSGRVVDVPTLFNVDTPSDFEAACKALSL